MGGVGHPAGPRQPKKRGNRIECRFAGPEIGGCTHVGQDAFQRFARFGYFPDEGVNDSTGNHFHASPRRRHATARRLHGFRDYNSLEREIISKTDEKVNRVRV
jgi:hypothetical protein